MMRVFMSVACGGLILVLLGGFGALYWWVPKWKAAIFVTGAAVTDLEKVNQTSE